MYGALFVRRGYGCYYFGDYFEPRYADRGFVTWGGYGGYRGREVVVVGGFYDPMYSYYRVTYRSDPYWQTGVTEIYIGRYRGDYARPPVTLVQQNVVVNNITVNNTTVNNITVNNSRINNVSMLTPLSQAAKTTNVKLQPVPREERLQHFQAAREMHAVAARRTEMETKLARTPNATPNAPRTLKMDAIKHASGITPVTAHGGAVTTPKTQTGAATHPVTTPGTGTTHPVTGTTTPGRTTPTTGTKPPAHTLPGHTTKEKEKKPVRERD